jgi:hypothetical protein
VLNLLIELSKIQILSDDDLNPLKFIGVNSQLDILGLYGLNPGSITVQQNTDIRPGIVINQELQLKVGVLCLLGQLLFADHQRCYLLVIHQQLLFVLS